MTFGISSPLTKSALDVRGLVRFLEVLIRREESAMTMGQQLPLAESSLS